MICLKLCKILLDSWHHIIARRNVYLDGLGGIALVVALSKFHSDLHCIVIVLSKIFDDWYFLLTETVLISLKRGDLHTLSSLKQEKSNQVLRSKRYERTASKLRFSN